LTPDTAHSSSPPSFPTRRSSDLYKPSADVVNVPPLKDFEKPEEHYSTKFHEMVHSTGHKDRLNREGIKDIARFGSETYSKEELIDRKSTRLNSSHVSISYAVFCL